MAFNVRVALCSLQRVRIRYVVMVLMMDGMCGLTLF